MKASNGRAALVFVATILWLVVSASPASAKGNGAGAADGFQKARWGMSKQAVASLYADYVTKQTEITVMASGIPYEGLSTLVTTFYFAEDKLVAVSVGVDARNGDVTDTVMRKLRAKYGKPVESQSDDVFVRTFHRARLSAFWKTPSTKVAFGVASKDGYDVGLLSFGSVRHEAIWAN